MIDVSSTTGAVIKFIDERTHPVERPCKVVLFDVLCLERSDLWCVVCDPGTGVVVVCGRGYVLGVFGDLGVGHDTQRDILVVILPRNSRLHQFNEMTYQEQDKTYGATLVQLWIARRRTVVRLIKPVRV